MENAGVIGDLRGMLRRKVTRVSTERRKGFCCKGAKKWDRRAMGKGGERRCHQDSGEAEEGDVEPPCGGRDPGRQLDTAERVDLEPTVRGWGLRG